MSQSSRLLLEKALLAQAAVTSWITVARQCPARIPQSLINSVRERMIVQTAQQWGWTTDITPSVDVDSLSKLRFDAKSLASMALAEDKAGFALEVLAARGGEHASLSSSDTRRATAARLMSAATGSTDLRQQVYDVTSLISNPDSTQDQATGLLTPTAAVVEMDCARSITKTLAATATATATSSSTTATKTTRRLSKNASLSLLLTLAEYHLWTAIQWGYPAFNSVFLT
ncbi:hypothetical protein [uncultured Bifidobacterium sp.]|uniref:hypothetical protein n=1 Tax=uncultured Bifidobacterium sp. TaxID=165187 RepID=UPI00262C2936|nr:hypothetical protein [uncultured Bifidobacterium sp.]